MMQKKSICNYLREINYIKESLIKRQNEIKANLEKYYLVERSAVVNEEEEKQISEDLAKVENIDGIFNELTQETDVKIKKAIRIMEMKRTKKTTSKKTFKRN